MRIIKILGGDDYGGQYVCECQYIEYWTSQGVVVDGYILGSGRAVSKYKDILSNYHILPELSAQFGGGLNNIFNGIKESFSYVKRNSKYFIFNTQYDAVIHRSQSFIVMASFVANQTMSKAYWHLPNSLNRFLSKLYYNLAIRRLDVTPVANSIYTKNTLGKICDHVIYPGFNEARVAYKEPLFRTKFDIDNEAIVYGTAARIHPSKAQHVLIEAFLESRVYENGSHLLIAGISEDDNYLKSCKKIAAKIEKNVHFLGNVDDMPTFYSSINVYVNSRIDAEPFGISIAESLAAGKPVIAYFKGGPSEMIIDGKNGKLVYHPDVESYKNAIKYLSDNHHTFDRSEIKKSSKKFGYKKNAQRFLQIIQSNN